MNEPSAKPRPTSSPASPPSARFPKSSRLLIRNDFRRVYDQGVRYTSRLFAAFCLDCSAQDSIAGRPAGARVGFTVPRAVGKSAKRNRIRRRMREAVRLDLALIGPQWDVVFNPRRSVLDAPFAEIRNEVRKLISRCKP